MSRPASGFEYVAIGDEVLITHHGRRATTLRGGVARRFLGAVEDDDAPQELMARLTGDYKHGNERAAKNHPRNRGKRR